MLTSNWLICGLICFIPLIALYVVLLLVVKDFNWWKGLLCVLIGFIALVPIVFFQKLFLEQNLIAAKTTGAVLLSALLLNGLIEEVIKTILLFAAPVPVKSPFGAFVRGLLSGMALGCIEVFVYLATGSETQLLRLASIWGIHVSCSILCSYFVYGICNKKIYVLSIFFAILFHGVYSYFAGYYTFMKYFCAAVIAISALECRVRYTKMLQTKDEVLDDLNKAEESIRSKK